MLTQMVAGCFLLSDSLGAEEHALGGPVGTWSLQDESSTSGMIYNAVSDDEGEIAHRRQEASGDSLFTRICGYGGSSAGTELVAGIIAICASVPAHVGSDSQVFHQCCQIS